MKSDLEPEKDAKGTSTQSGNAKNVTYVREDRNQLGTYITYKASRITQIDFMRGKQMFCSICEMWLGKYDANFVQFDKAWAAYGDLLEYAEKDLRHFEVYKNGLETISYLLAEYCLENEDYNKAILFYELAHDFEDGVIPVRLFYVLCQMQSSKLFT